MLEESNAADIVESVSNYARRRGRGVCVLSGTGTVVNVTMKQPAGSSVVTLHGRFEILSLSDLKKTKPLSFGSQNKKKKKKKQANKQTNKQTPRLEIDLTNPDFFFFNFWVCVLVQDILKSQFM